MVKSVRKSLRKIKKNKRSKTVKGGKAIASGAYGCVFNPALRCMNSSVRQPDSVSKLLLKTAAETEYKKIQTIIQKLQTIPKYRNYFALDGISLCTPSELEPSDLIDYTKICKNSLVKQNLTVDNINRNLNSLRILNIKNGGDTIEDYLDIAGSFQNMYRMHTGLVKMFKNGIMPMNVRDVYHCDIKSSNILIDRKYQCRLIDWGLSTEYVPNMMNPFPTVWRNRPLQFNVPFSVIIFTDKFNRDYSKFIRENNGGGGGGGGAGHTGHTEEMLKPFVIKYIEEWIRDRGEGHYKFINNIFNALFINDVKDGDPEEDPEIFEKEYTMNTIVEYIVDILIHYTVTDEKGSVSFRKYLDEVFIKIIDIWGFIHSYYEIVELLSKNFDTLTPVEKKIFNQLTYIFMTYAYYPRHTPIDMDEFFIDLDILGKLLHSKSGDLPAIPSDSESEPESDPTSV